MHKNKNKSKTRTLAYAYKQQSLPTFRQAGPIFPPTAILFSAPRLPYLISRSNCVLLEFHNSPQTHLSDTFHSIILQLQYNQPPNSWIISTSLQPILKFQQTRLAHLTYHKSKTGLQRHFTNSQKRKRTSEYWCAFVSTSIAWKALTVHQSHSIKLRSKNSVITD